MAADAWESSKLEHHELLVRDDRPGTLSIPPEPKQRAEG
jgi:hypothetical protein